MPQLDKGTAQRTASAEGWDVPDDWYEVELKAVHDRDPKGKKEYKGKESGNPYWNWVVVFPEDANEGRFKKREIWVNISLAETMDNFRNAAFTAFGGDPSKSTDLMIGKRARALVKSEEYQGQKSPKVKAFVPLTDDDQTSKGAVNESDVDY